MRPAFLRHLRVVALGDRPGARRVHDARSLAGNEPAVVAGIVPGVNLRRIHRHQLLEVFQRRARLVGVDLDVVLGVDHDDAVGVEQRADPVDGVARLAHRQADGIAGLKKFFRGRKIRIPVPRFDLRLVPFRFVGRVHVAQVDAGMLLVEIEARAARLHLASHRGRHAAPGALDPGKIFGDRTDRAVLLDELADDVVERLEHVGVDADIPIAVRHDVVAGAGLRLGGRGQLVLLALRGDVVDLHLDVVFLAPLVAERGERLVGAGDPMVPAAQRQFPGGVTVLDVGRGNGSDRTDAAVLRMLRRVRNGRVKAVWVTVSSLVAAVLLAVFLAVFLRSISASGSTYSHCGKLASSHQQYFQRASIAWVPPCAGERGGRQRAATGGKGRDRHTVRPLRSPPSGLPASAENAYYPR